MSVQASRARVSAFVAMLACSIPAAAVQATAPAPAPSAAAGAPVAVRASALKEIGHVHARSEYCQEVLDHAAFATSTALINDQSIIDTATLLDHTNIEDNAMAKPKAVFEIQRTYEALMGRSREALGEAKAIRKEADDAPTPEQKAAMIAYADALAGAIYRQEQIARDYRQFGVYIETKNSFGDNLTNEDPGSWQQQNRDIMTQSIQGPHVGGEGYVDPRDRVAPPLAQLAKEESAHITEVHQKVIDDEVVAGGNVEAGLGPCQPEASQ